MAWITNLKSFERLKDSAEYMKAVYGTPVAYLKVGTLLYFCLLISVFF